MLDLKIEEEKKDEFKYRELSIIMKYDYYEKSVDDVKYDPQSFTFAEFNNFFY